MIPNYKKTLIACYLGYITQAIVVNLTPLFFVIFQTNYNISYTQIGSIVLFTFIIQMMVDLVMVKLLPKIGYRACAIAAHICSVIGLVLLGILPLIMPSYIGILISVFFYSIGGGLIEVIISPIVDSLPGDAKASGMSLLHSFYSWGQMLVVLVSTLILKIIGDNLWNYIPFLWALLPLINTFNFVKVPLIPISQEQKQSSAIGFLKSPVFIISFLTMICSGASELAMSQWASLFAEQGLGVSKVMGDLLGPCLFAVFMGIGRTLYGIKGDKINLEAALLSCAGLTVVCYLVTVFVNIPAIALLGCAVCGLGVSLMWPGMLSYTSYKYNYNAGPVMFGLLALGGDIGCSIGPWLTGKVSDLYIAFNHSNVSVENLSNSAIKAGLLAAIIFPMAMIVLIIIMKNLRTKKKV